MRQTVGSERSSMPRFCIALGLLLTAAAAACAVNPVRQQSEAGVISAEKERQVGDEAARKVEAEMGLADDPALPAYVQPVGAHLAKPWSRHDVLSTFQIVDIAAPPIGGTMCATGP